MSRIAENRVSKFPDAAIANASGKHTFFQPKLSVNEPGDAYEQEADTMADRVMRMKIPASQSFFKSAPTLLQRKHHGASELDDEELHRKEMPSVQRKCEHCEEEDKMLQRKEETDAGSFNNTGLDKYTGSLDSSGQSLSDASRGFFEPRFGYDFSNVRVHTDAEAAKSAQSINALAYTTGNHIVFNQGQYAPNSEAGQKLMAHELTHVVQQRSNVAAPKIQRHKDDIVAYSGGQNGFIWVIQAGRLIYTANAVSGHVGRGENEPNAGPIPTGKYMLHPNIVASTVSKLEGGVCGADGISTGFQEITSHDPSPCSLSHYCNVPCPTKDNPDQKCFTPIDCWGPKRIRVEGSADVVNPAGKHVTRGGFFIHGGNPADAVSSGCVKSLDNGVFDNIRKLSGIKGAVPFCVGSACPATVNNAVIGAVLIGAYEIGSSLINDIVGE